MSRTIISLVVLSIGLSTLPVVGGQREEAYKKLAANVEQARQQREQLQQRRDQMLAARSKIGKDRKELDAARRDANDSSSAAAIDYSRYDRCPNGHTWGECNHTPQKEQWLREQTDKSYRLQKGLERVMDDLIASQQAIQDRLGNYSTDVASLNDDAKSLKADAAKLAQDMKDFRLLPDVKVDAQLNDKVTTTVKAELDKRADGYERREDGKTQCNIFAADYAKTFLGRDVPQLMDTDGTAPALASAQLTQLTTAAAEPKSKVQKLDWAADPQDTLRRSVDLANQGKLVVIVDKGHIATVVPSDKLHDSGSWKLAVPMVTQAGAKVAFPDEPIPLSEAWGKNARKDLKIFVIDP